MNNPAIAPPLIPRAHLFGDPASFNPQIEPNGQRMAWLAPHQGAMNIWLAPVDAMADALPITHVCGQGIGLYAWTYQARYVVYLRDLEGDENYHVHCVDIETGTCRDLTPFAGSRSMVVAISRQRPQQILVMCNKRSPQCFDLYTLDLETGECQCVLENPGFMSFTCDDFYQPRFASRLSATGELELLRRDEQGLWLEWLRFPAEDARVSRALMLSRDGKRLFLLDSRNRDTAALVSMELDSGVTRVIAQDPGADITELLFSLDTYEPVAYCVTRERRAYFALDARLHSDIEHLRTSGVMDWRLLSRSQDDRLWVIASSADCRPPVVHLYDRGAGSVKRLMSVYPTLDAVAMRPMQCIDIIARDGHTLVSYVTRPDPACDISALVLLVHGGPWARDSYGFNSYHQWLSDRGYSVMSVNFRGSSGFGKAFINAGDGEWGRQMDDDLLDAVDWAVGQGIADSQRVSIMGVSYGGYAVLASMVRTPERYACGIDLCGPANLETFIDAMPPYWGALRHVFVKAIGDPQTHAGRALLRERSPIHHTHRLKKPLLVGHGANDVRVRRDESDQLCAALRDNAIPVTYLLFPDEGHGLQRPQNTLYFNAMIEAFLARYLGGRVETVTAAERDASSAQCLMAPQGGLCEVDSDE